MYMRKGKIVLEGQIKRKILVVEDEESISMLLKFNLQSHGYDVEVAYDGEQALEKIEHNQFACILLDLMIPKIDGVDVCKRIRELRIFTPILMLTAMAEEAHKIFGLEVGADDYLTKPFSPKEVIARVKALIRRADYLTNDSVAQYKDKKLAVGHIVIYPDRYEVYVEDELVEFTPKEFELLLDLVRNKGYVRSRDQLLSAVWDYEFAGDTRIVDVHISRVRDKIEKDSKNPKYIKTIRGLGYKFEEIAE